MKFNSRFYMLLVFALLGCGGLRVVLSTYTVRISSDKHESISPDMPQTVDRGSKQSFTVIADTDYILSTTVGGTCPDGSWKGSTYTTGIIDYDCFVSFSSTNPNAPWYPSLNAFEHYDSGRSHLFSQATFAGDFAGGSTINISSSSTSYPSLYNMTYLDADHVFAYGGGYGDVSGSIGAFVAKINPDTLATTWKTQLTDTSVSGEWDYPGVMGILDDGYLYVVYGYRLSRINPTTGAVIKTLLLPTGAGLPENTAYNGFDATADGILVMKSIYREAGCGIQGPSALLNCPDPTDIPSSVLVSVNPETMTVVDQVTLPTPSFSGVMVGTYNSENYVYLSGATSWSRYLISNSGNFILDTSWNPGTILLSGQTSGSTLVVMKDWVIGQTNATPASTELSVVAVNQGNAQQQFSIQPFVGDPIPPLVSSAFSTAGPGGTQAISWMPVSVSADPDTNIIYAMDALPGKITGIHLDANGFTTIWKADQRTTESVTIIGSQSQRVIVGTDIPSGQIPGNNSNNYVVWRNAATGAEIARSPLLSQMTSGSMVQPYYSGDMFFEGITGTLTKLMPTP